MITEALRGGLGYSTAGDKSYRDPAHAAGFHGEQIDAGMGAGATAAAKPARWYADPAGPRPKIAWLGGSTAQIKGRPLWEAPLSGGGTRGGGTSVIR